MINDEAMSVPWRDTSLPIKDATRIAATTRSGEPLRPLRWLAHHVGPHIRTPAQPAAKGPLVLIAAAPQVPWRAWQHALEVRGCQIQTAHDGVRARAVAVEHHPRGAILALEGDGFDNCSLAQELHEITPAPIHVLVWSGPPGNLMALALLAETDAIVMAAHVSADALAERMLAMIGPGSSHWVHESNEVARAGPGISQRRGESVLHG